MYNIPNDDKSNPFVDWLPVEKVWTLLDNIVLKIK